MASTPTSSPAGHALAAASFTPASPSPRSTSRGGSSVTRTRAVAPEGPWAAAVAECREKGLSGERLKASNAS